MALSVASSGTIGEEEKPSASSKLDHTAKDHLATDANIMAETADEPQNLDLEVGGQLKDAEKVNPMDPSSFPDGGLKAWLSVSGAFCCTCPSASILLPITNH